METKHRRWRKTQFMTSCGGSQPYPNLLFSTTPFDRLNLVSFFPQDSLYPFQLFLMEEFNSSQTPSDYIKIPLEPHQRSSADQWSGLENDSNIGRYAQSMSD